MPQRKKERERERERICPCVTQFMITWAPYDRVKRVWTSESDKVKPGFEFQFSSIPSCVLLSKLILLQNINYLNHILKGVRIWESNIIHVSIKIFNYKQQRHILANLSRRGIYSRLSCCFQHFWEGWRTRREKEGPRKAEQQPGPQKFRAPKSTWRLPAPPLNTWLPQLALPHLLLEVDIVDITHQDALCLALPLWSNRYSCEVQWLVEPTSQAPKLRA